MKGVKKKGSPVLLWSLVLGGVVLLIGGVVAAYFLFLKQEEFPPLKTNPQAKDSGKKDQGGKKDSPKDLGKPDDRARAWKPDAAILAKLDKETTVQGHKIQPPKGYVLEQKPVGPGRQYLWKGPERPDQSSPHLIMSYTPVGPGKPSLDAVFKTQLGVVRKTLLGAFPTGTTSPPEHGKINGLDFIRSRLNLSNADKTLQLEGFAYVTIDGDSSFLFMSTELKKNSASLKVHEATVQTFKK
jgi:hypothetical protein